MQFLRAHRQPVQRGRAGAGDARAVRERHAASLVYCPVAPLVHDEAAIGIPVEGEADVRAGLAHPCLQVLRGQSGQFHG